MEPSAKINAGEILPVNEKTPPFQESRLANAIGHLVIRSSRLDYLLRSALAVFIAEDITDNRIYDKAELIVTKFWKVSHVVDLLEDLAPRVLCRWYWEDFDHVFVEVRVILNERNSHSHNVFHILDEDTYQTSSATDHQKAMMGESGPRKKLQEKHSLGDLKKLVKRTSDCIAQLEHLMATPPKGPILRADFLKLPNDQRHAIVERENRDRSQSFELPEDWFHLDVAPGVHLNQPGIYIWEIEDFGKYIGEYTRIKRPTKRYAWKVRRIINEQPHHDKSNPIGFGHIHSALAKAHLQGKKIVLHVAENASDPKERHAKQAKLIAKCGNLNRPRNRPR
jgi:hypothetical protein